MDTGIEFFEPTNKRALWMVIKVEKFMILNLILILILIYLNENFVAHK